MFMQTPLVLRVVLCVVFVLGWSATASAGYVTSDDLLPPPRFESGEIDGTNYTYDGLDRRIRTDNNIVLPPRMPAPAPDFPAESFFDVYYELEFYDGDSWDWWTGDTSMLMRLDTVLDDEITRIVEMEVLEMEMVNPANPDHRLRESPLLPSTGTTTLTDLGGGLYHIDSFFDVFFELTMDGGESWELPIGALEEGAGAIHMTAVPEPSTLAIWAIGVLGVCAFGRRWRPAHRDP